MPQTLYLQLNDGEHKMTLDDDDAEALLEDADDRPFAVARDLGTELQEVTADE